jgi:gamma-glutamylcyclotransferase
MHFGRLRARTSSAELIESAALENHGLYFNKRGRDGSGKCHAGAQTASRVYGVVYRISNAQQRILDRAEGPGYARGYAVVSGLASGRSHRVFLYRAKAISIDDTLRPYDWYRALVLAGAAQNGLPAAYIAQLRQVQTWQDPNRRRSREQFNIMLTGQRL